MSSNFLNLYTHDFARVAIAAPVCRIADPVYNAQQTILLAEQAAEQGAALVAFPELGLAEEDYQTFTVSGFAVPILGTGQAWLDVALRETSVVLT